MTRFQKFRFDDLFMDVVSALKIVSWQDRPGLIKVTLLSILTGVIQTIGVVSVLPFLAVVTNVSAFRDSGIGQILHRFTDPLNDQQLILCLGVLFFVLTAASSTAVVYTSYYNKRFIWNFLHKLRSSVLDALLTRELDYFESKDSAILLKHLEADCVEFSTSVVASLIEIVSKFVLVLGITAVLLHFNAKVIGILLFVLVFTYLLLFIVFRHYLATDHAQRNHYFEEVYLSIKELFQSIKYVLLQKKHSYWVDRFSEVSSHVSKIEPRVHLVSILPRYIFEIIGILLLVSFISFKTIQGENLTSTLPMLGFIVFAIYRLNPAFQTIYASINRIFTYSFIIPLVKESLETGTSKFVSSGRVDNDTIDCGHLNTKAKIMLQGTTFGHPDRGQQLNDANLIISEGDCIALTGHTGSGKSTLLDLILGFRFPTDGLVFVNGKKLTHTNRDEWRAEIGYAGQETTLINASVIDNVVFGSLKKNAATLERVRYFCQIACIDDFIENNLPQSYDTIIGESGKLISGGQRQRIGLARALFNNPSVLILDEATNALDLETERQLFDNLSSLTPKLTIISVSHRLSNLSHFFAVYKLENGKLALMSS